MPYTGTSLIKQTTVNSRLGPSFKVKISVRVVEGKTVDFDLYVGGQHISPTKSTNSTTYVTFTWTVSSVNVEPGETVAVYGTYTSDVDGDSVTVYGKNLQICFDEKKRQFASNQ